MIEEIKEEVVEKDEVDEIIETITNIVVEKVFNDERFLALTAKADEEEAVVEETPEVPEVVEEEKVEEEVDNRSTIEKIRDRLRGIK